MRLFRGFRRRLILRTLELCEPSASNGLSGVIKELGVGKGYRDRGKRGVGLGEMPHLLPKEEKKNLLWLLSMPSPQLKPYKGGIVCVPLLRALVVTGRGLWLDRVVVNGRL